MMAEGRQARIESPAEEVTLKSTYHRFIAGKCDDGFKMDWTTNGDPWLQR